MRRIATISTLAASMAALMAAVPLLDASAEGCCKPGRRAYYYAPLQFLSPFEAWRSYYGVQAEVSAARRAGRARYYGYTGRALPSRYFGPPTNYYAEHYALNPYAYFNCDLARRGEGICADPDFFK